MSLAGVFDTYWKPVGDEDLAGFYDYDFSYMGDSNVFGSEGYSGADTQISDKGITQTSLGQDLAGFLDFDPEQKDMAGNFGKAIPSTVISQSSQQEFDDLFDPPSIAQLMKREVFEALGIGKETAAAISRFAKGAQRGGGKERQAQAGGRTGPALPTSARAPTTPAGRTSRARQATSGEQAVQRAIQQSQRATSAARAIANQMARAGTVTSTNDLADMISGSTKPMGTRQKLPGANLRQLAIPRTGMA